MYWGSPRHRSVMIQILVSICPMQPPGKGAKSEKNRHFEKPFWIIRQLQFITSVKPKLEVTLKCSLISVKRHARND